MKKICLWAGGAFVVLTFAYLAFDTTYRKGFEAGVYHGSKLTVNWYNTNIFSRVLEQMGKENMKSFKPTNYNK